MDTSLINPMTDTCKTCNGPTIYDPKIYPGGFYCPSPTCPAGQPDLNLPIKEDTCAECNDHRSVCNDSGKAPCHISRDNHWHTWIPCPSCSSPKKGEEKSDTPMLDEMARRVNANPHFGNIDLRDLAPTPNPEPGVKKADWEEEFDDFWLKSEQRTKTLNQHRWEMKDFVRHLLTTAKAQGREEGYRQGQEDQYQAEKATAEGRLLSRDIPMGVSQWLEHGNKYGYDTYFIEQAREEGRKEMLDELTLDGKLR